MVKRKKSEKVNEKVNELNKKSIKPLKIKFCPNCKSGDVRFVFRLQNLFGLLPKIECLRCGNSAPDFPVLIVNPDDKKLKEKKDVKGKKIKRVKKKKVNKKTVKKTKKGVKRK